MLRRAALPEVLNARDFHPGMFRLFENRLDRSWEIWNCDRANGHADHRRQIVRLPIDRRTALRAKIAADLAAACGCPDVFLRRPRDRDGLRRIERADTERRARSTLAVDAMTGDDEAGRSWKRQRESAAPALGIGHRDSLLPRWSCSSDGAQRDPGYN